MREIIWNVGEDLKWWGEMGGNRGGDNLNGGGGVEMVEEREGKHGGDNLKCGGRLEMMGGNGGKHGGR
jgi:hypothetical protein